MSRVCPSWLSFVLYNPVRKAFTDREKILSESRITSESAVLEIGPGNGFITEVLADRASSVVSVELQSGMVKKLKSRIRRFGGVVTVITGDIASLSVGDDIADVCILYYSFHEIREKAGAVANICKAVKTNGILSIYEPTIEVSRKKMDNTLELFIKNGFRKEHEHTTLFTRFARLKKVEGGVKFPEHSVE